MLDRTVLRWGGLMAVVGAAVALVVRVLNLLHHAGRGSKPRMTHETDPLLDELADISDSAQWLVQHYASSIAIALLLVGIVAVALSHDDEPARSWARFAMPLVIAGIGIAGFSIGCEIALERSADAWVEDPSDINYAAARSIAMLGGVTYTATIASIYGIAALFLGIMTLSSARYPRGLGYIGIVGGLIGMVDASLLHFEVTSRITATYVPFVASVLLYVWVFMTGWRLWKESPGTTAPAP